MSKPIKFIDIHGHINFDDYDADRLEVIKRSQEAGVGMITVGTDLKSSAEALQLAKVNENIWATVGVHPTDTSEAFDKTELMKLASDAKVVAIGECGLDYFHAGPEAHARQKETFIAHIELANELNKPLMLHVRNGKENLNAYQDAVEIIKEHSKVRANFHFFAGNLDDLKSILDIGATVSFTGVITFVRDYDEVVRYSPLTSIMSETDCPYVSPAPHRGKRNEPSYVIEVVKAIAKIRAEDEDKVREQLVQNSKQFFSLD